MTINISEDIVYECKKNSLTGQEKLYKTCYPIMIMVCLRYTRDETQAQALLNEAFLKVFKKISSFEGKGSILFWIKRIVTNTCIDFVRAQKRDLLNNSKDLEEINPYTNTNPLVLEKLEAEKLLQLIDCLPEIRALIFKMAAIEGYSHKEISQKLEINESTSRWHLLEARKTLQLKISELYDVKYEISIK